MTSRFALTVLLTAVLAVAAAAPALTAPPAGYTRVLTGTAAGDADYSLYAKRDIVDGDPALCQRIQIAVTGVWSSQGGACVTGPIAEKGNLVARWHRATNGTRIVANLVTGVTVAQAAKVVVVFANGRRASARTQRAPLRVRSALGAKELRYYVVDGLRRTAGKPVRAEAYTSGGHRIGRVLFHADS